MNFPSSSLNFLLIFCVVCLLEDFNPQLSTCIPLDFFFVNFLFLKVLQTSFLIFIQPHLTFIFFSLHKIIPWIWTFDIALRALESQVSNNIHETQEEISLKLLEKKNCIKTVNSFIFSTALCCLFFFLSLLIFYSFPSIQVQENEKIFTQNVKRVLFKPTPTHNWSLSFSVSANNFFFSFSFQLDSLLAATETLNFLLSFVLLFVSIWKKNNTARKNVVSLCCCGFFISLSSPFTCFNFFSSAHNHEKVKSCARVEKTSWILETIRFFMNNLNEISSKWMDFYIFSFLHIHVCTMNENEKKEQTNTKNKLAYLISFTLLILQHWNFSIFGFQFFELLCEIEWMKKKIVFSNIKDKEKF